MGFLDKVKNAGKGLLKGVLLMSATSYGSVAISGSKHSMCKVGSNSTFDTLYFIKGPILAGEYKIKDSIKNVIVLTDKDAQGEYLIRLEFKDGEKSDVNILIDKNRGSALPSAEERVNAQYGNTAKFVKGLVTNVSGLSAETMDWARRIMAYGNVK